MHHTSPQPSKSPLKMTPNFLIDNFLGPLFAAASPNFREIKFPFSAPAPCHFGRRHHPPNAILFPSEVPSHD